MGVVLAAAVGYLDCDYTEILQLDPFNRFEIFLPILDIA